MAKQYKRPDRKRRNPSQGEIGGAAVVINASSARMEASNAEDQYRDIKFAESCTTNTTPPTLLTISRELRDKILKYCMVIGVVDLEVYRSRPPMYWADYDPIP